MARKVVRERTRSAWDADGTEASPPGTQVPDDGTAADPFDWRLVIVDGTDAEAAHKAAVELVQPVFGPDGSVVCDPGEQYASAAGMDGGVTYREVPVAADASLPDWC